MNKAIEQLIEKATTIETGPPSFDLTHNTTIERFDKEKFAKLVVEETLKQVNEIVFLNEDNAWRNGDAEWVRLHFGYGILLKDSK